MKEGVAGPIREFYKPKAFVGIEPLDGPTHRWTRRWLDGCSTKPRSRAESTRVWLVGIVVEVTTPRMTKVLFSHGSLRWLTDQVGWATI
jgi:hypothetical protein